MARVVLFPFPRISSSALEWSPISASIAGDSLELDEIVDRWDANADLGLHISVSVPSAELLAKKLEGSAIQLVLTVSCRETSLTVSAQRSLMRDGPHFVGGAQVRIHGANIAQFLDIRAQLVTSRSDPDASHSAWLRRCVVADGPVTRIALDHSLDGFPTSSFSFRELGIPAAPWRLIVVADDAEMAFSSAIRLELNEDYSVVRNMIAGRPAPHVDQELLASITRVLIATVARLTEDDAEGRSADAIADEAPDSLAAAAQRAAQQYFGAPLSAAIRELRQRPEYFDSSIAHGVGTLSGSES